MKTIIYQLLPRLFTNTTPNCQPNGTLLQNGCGKLNDITPERLSKIRELGTTHIWFTGVIAHATKTDFSRWGIPRQHPAVVKGEAGSPYAITDYYDIDPALACDVDRRMDEFQALVNRTHQAGMRVIIDFVPNHVARQYNSICRPDGIDNLGHNDDNIKFFDPQNNFYYITGQAFAPHFNIGNYREMPARATGNDCFSASPSENDWYETIKLNYGIDPWNGSKHFDPIPDTWRKMLHILRFWAAKGIDGFRCDMAHMVPVEFWHWAISQIKADFPSIIFIAEIYDTNLYKDYVEYGGFDFLYDKVTLYDTLINILCHNQSTQSITHCWQTIGDLEPHMLNFLENHDEQRLASPQLTGNSVAAMPALVVSATISTAAMMIYAGQELGEPALDAEGFSGQDGRTTIFDYWSVPSLRRWLTTGRAPRLRQQYAKILRLCNTEPAITDGVRFDLMYANPQLNRQYAFFRRHGNDLLLITANFDCQAVDFTLNIPEHAFQYLNITPGNYRASDLLSRDRIDLHLNPAQNISISLTPYGSAIWKIRLK